MRGSAVQDWQIEPYFPTSKPKKGKPFVWVVIHLPSGWRNVVNIDGGRDRALALAQETFHSQGSAA
jgi:hypothetical protein